MARPYSGYALQVGLRGNRLQTARLALSIGSNQDVDQGEEPGKPGNDESVERVTTRRFPAPWSVRELEQAFRQDANGQAVAYTYFRRDENEAPLQVGNTLPLS